MLTGGIVSGIIKKGLMEMGPFLYVSAKKSPTEVGEVGLIYIYAINNYIEVVSSHEVFVTHTSVPRSVPPRLGFF